MQREIIINKMYVGTYLTYGNNIGHEIINLYKADNGENYIYLTSQGTIPAIHRKKEITILLIRRFAPKMYMVMAKAEDITVLDCADNKKPKAKRYEMQKTLNLSYGDVPLVQLFDQNCYYGGQEQEKNSYVTFKAGRIIKPKIQLLITDDKDKAELQNAYYIRTQNGFGKETMREYFDELDRPDSFIDLMSIVENNSLWEEDNTTKKIAELTSINVENHNNFLRIIKQEDHELAYSNLFAHFFCVNSDAFVLFAQEVLGINIKKDYCVEREKNRIDILVSDSENVIVIENKIKSGINGVDGINMSESGSVLSQLQKYYTHITEHNSYKGKNFSFFIFTPNYNRLDLSNFKYGNKYKIIKFSDIYGFYDRNRNLFINEPYFEDFVNALYKHTKDYDDELEEEMQRRFLKIIQKAKKE